MVDSNLTEFVRAHAGDDRFRVQDDLGQGFVRLRAAEAQRRQAMQDIRCVEDAVIELLRNSRDAGAHLLCVATWREGDTRCVTVLDDASGIPSGLHETVFEPFVTSKLDTLHDDRWGVHGRGMALYSIRQNCDVAHIAASAPGLGSSFHIEAEIKHLPEKRDQSTLPVVVSGEDGKTVLRGPHNILRTVMEFAIDERRSTVVYLGSPAEIVATLVSLGQEASGRLADLCAPIDDSTPFIQRFARADDAEHLAQLAGDLALPLSIRTARRILNNETASLPLLITCLARPTDPTSEKSVSLTKTSPRSIPTKIDQADLDLFTRELERPWKQLAQLYYLRQNVTPQVSVRGGELIVRIPLEPDDDS